MTNNKRIDPDYAPDEKKVWWPVSMMPCNTPKGKSEGDYFMGIEELQGAWIGEGENKYWEEAEGGSEEWDEEMVDENGAPLLDERGFTRTKTVRRDILRARRYVVKRVEGNGRVKNAYDGAYAGPRKWS